MRKIYDPITGADVTTAVQATLAAGRSLVTQYIFRWEFMDLIAYNPYGNWSSFCFTDAAWPIYIESCQLGPGVAQQIGVLDRAGGFTPGFNFFPEVFAVDKLSYGIGFEDRPVEVTWMADDNKDYPAYGDGDTNPIFLSGAISPTGLTVKKAFAAGIFSEVPFWIHQAIYTDFPNQGGVFLGTTLMFRGFVRGLTVTRSLLKLKLASLMDVFQTTQLPTQTLTPNNRALPYVPAAVSAYGNDFTVVSIPNQLVVEFSTSETIPENAMQDSWMTFQPATYAGIPIYLSGNPPAIPFRIQGNSAVVGPGPNNVTVYFYDPPIVPNTPAVISTYAQLTNSGGVPGFPYLPPPEFSA